MTLEDWRLFYAEEIRIAAGLDSAALVAAYSRVPREKFMGPGPWQIASPDMVSMGLMGFPGALGVAFVFARRGRLLLVSVLGVLLHVGTRAATAMQTRRGEVRP